MTVHRLFRWGGLSAIAAGVLFLVAAVLRGFGLAPLAGQWAIFAYVILLFFVLTAVYTAQIPQIGKLGFVGYVLAIIGLGFTEVIAFLILAGYAGLPAAHEVQMFAWSRIPIINLAVLFNIAGGVLLGVGTIRAGILPGWAGLLLVIAEVSNFLHEYLLPLPRLMIIPAALFAASFIGMGWALSTRQPAPVIEPSLAPAI